MRIGLVFALFSVYWPAVAAGTVSESSLLYCEVAGAAFGANKDFVGSLAGLWSSGRASVQQTPNAVRFGGRGIRWG